MGKDAASEPFVTLYQLELAEEEVSRARRVLQALYARFAQESTGWEAGDTVRNSRGEGFVVLRFIGWDEHGKDCPSAVLRGLDEAGERKFVRIDRMRMWKKSWIKQGAK
tara:strand:- start:42 stop:368 length:327 start_codon:yes stop_codon:yes gene_type:complete